MLQKAVRMQNTHPIQMAELEKNLSKKPLNGYRKRKMASNETKQKKVVPLRSMTLYFMYTIQWQ